MVNVIVRDRETKKLVGFVLRQQSNCWSNPAQFADFFPRLTERILRAVRVLSWVEGIEECLVHHSWRQQTCFLPGVRDVSSKKTLKWKKKVRLGFVVSNSPETRQHSSSSSSCLRCSVWKSGGRRGMRGRRRLSRHHCSRLPGVPGQLQSGDPERRRSPHQHWRADLAGTASHPTERRTRGQTEDCQP